MSFKIISFIKTKFFTQNEKIKPREYWEEKIKQAGKENLSEEDLEFLEMPNGFKNNKK